MLVVVVAVDIGAADGAPSRVCRSLLVVGGCLSLLVAGCASVGSGLSLPQYRCRCSQRQVGGCSSQTRFRASVSRSWEEVVVGTNVNVQNGNDESRMERDH